MIKFKEVDTKDIIKEMRQLADQRTIARMVSRDIAPPIERRIDAIVKQPAPPRTSIKFVWSLNRAANARARRWWFANLRAGNIPTDGQHYLRSGVIENSWQNEIFLDGDEVVLSFFNPADGAEYVYGSPEQTQVPGHATTGWLNYKDLLVFTDVVRSETRIAWEQLIVDTTKAASKRKR
jgi:hypothetical protein